jgi:hypothetical protein
MLLSRANLISLQGDVANNASFITYPDPEGTVNLLGRGSVALNTGFVLSDASPTIMPTFTNIAAVLANFTTTVVTSDNQATTTLTPSFPRIYSADSTAVQMGGANFLAGQDPAFLVLGSDPEDLSAVQIEGLGWLQNSPLFDVAVRIFPRFDVTGNLQRLELSNHRSHNQTVLQTHGKNHGQRSQFCRTTVHK